MYNKIVYLYPAKVRCLSCLAAAANETYSLGSSRTIPGLALLDEMERLFIASMSVNTCQACRTGMQPLYFKAAFYGHFMPRLE